METVGPLKILNESLAFVYTVHFDWHQAIGKKNYAKAGFLVQTNVFCER